MQTKIQKFSIQKLGNAASQNQDAVNFDPTSNIFCISDGSTESSYSKEWSSLLVKEFIKKPFDKSDGNPNLKSWIGVIQKEWYDLVPWDELYDWSEDIAEKAQIGAQATFLGIILYIDKTKPKLSAWAIGDSNLFIIRDDDLIKSFPLEKSDDFGTSPQLVFSMSRKIHSDENNSDSFVCSSRDLLSVLGFELHRGDLIIATTDALAKWILSEYEIGNLPWNKLWNIDDFDSFTQLKIVSNEMKNDDVTMLIIEI